MEQTKKEIEKKAKKLTKRLDKKVGGKWIARVWENGGWCYDAHLGTISVTENKYFEKSSYFALISSKLNVSNFGLGAWTDDSDSADTPEMAVANAMIRAQNYADNLIRVLDDNNKKMLS